MGDLFDFSWHSIAFILITMLWWLEFRIFPSTGSRRQDAGSQSFKFILGAILTTILISIIFAIIDFGVITGFPGRIIQMLGIVLYSFGLVLRYWCSYLLGIYFTRDIAVQEGQELVSSGPYRILRHPLYLGLLLLTLGVPLYFGSLPGLFLGGILMPWAIRERILTEERKLSEALGKKYTDWGKDRYRLIPFIY